MEHQVNPLMESLKLPGRIFQLPSKGLFYKNGELSADIREGEVHVRPMSAMDEINMKNPDQLFSGEAVRTVFKHCVDGIEKPEALLSKDVDALMVFLRVVTYGPGYDFTARHTCKDAKQHQYTTDIENIISTIVSIDPTTVDKDYSLTLPNGQFVKLKPAGYQQVVDLIKENENKTEISVELQQQNLLMMLMGVIDQVDKITDRKMIEEWVRALPPPLVKRISTKIEQVDTWGPNLTIDCKCKDCGETFKIEIPINPVSFFTE